MVKILNIKNWNIKLIFKSKYPKPKKPSLRFNHEWRTLKLGIFCNKNIILGSKDFSDHKKWKNNFVPNYTFGVNLIIFNIWVEWNKGGMYIKETK